MGQGWPGLIRCRSRLLPAIGRSVRSGSGAGTHTDDGPAVRLGGAGSVRRSSCHREPLQRPPPPVPAARSSRFQPCGSQDRPSGPVRVEPPDGSDRRPGPARRPTGRGGRSFRPGRRRRLTDPAGPPGEPARREMTRRHLGMRLDRTGRIVHIRNTGFHAETPRDAETQRGAALESLGGRAGGLIPVLDSELSASLRISASLRETLHPVRRARRSDQSSSAIDSPTGRRHPG